MKKWILLLIVPFTLLFSQTEDEKQIDLTGKFALMFQIDQNFDLNSFDGMSFAGKYFFNDDWGIRLVFQTRYTESDESTSYNKFTPSQYQSETDDRDVVSYKVAPSIVYKFENSNNIKFFLGTGPFIDYSNNEWSEVFYQNEGEISINKEQYKNYAIGFTVFANVEWFVTNNISLSAEYGFEYSYLETEGWSGNFLNDRLMEERNLDNTRKSFRGLPVSLGVSIYF